VDESKHLGMESRRGGGVGGPGGHLINGGKAGDVISDKIIIVHLQYQLHAPTISSTGRQKCQ
jgi:hypothetical protein